MRNVVSLHKLFNYAPRLTVNPIGSDVKIGVISKGYPNTILFQKSGTSHLKCFEKNFFSLLQISSL
jgi:hypothetical protein